MKFIPQFEPLIKVEYADAVHQQIMSGYIGPGDKVIEFENKICEITGAKHCIATTSGTTALFISLLALNPRCRSYCKGVIVAPDYTFLAAHNAAKLAGEHIDLIDIKEDTLCMNPNLIENKSFMSCVIFVNHNGYVGQDRYKIREICDAKSIPMIEDSSQSLGIWDEHGVHAGCVGDVGVFSFSVPKIITMGQGGCIITDNDKIAEKCDQLRDQGGNWRKTKVHNHIGGNFKFNDILASYGLEQLNRLDELLAKRKQIFDWYRNYIELVDYGYDSTWMCLYKTIKAKEIIKKLADNNIQATQYYNPIHTNPPYNNIEDDNFPVSIKVSQEIVYLPSSLTLIEEDVDRICGVIKEFE